VVHALAQDEEGGGEVALGGQFGSVIGVQSELDARH
jgi:hypothetical protein